MNPKDKQTLLDIVQANKSKYKRWNLFRPSIKNNYDDLLQAVQGGNLTMNRVPSKQWESHTDNKSRLGYYVPDPSTGGGTITVPENVSDQTIGHELLHYFSGHKEGGRNVPKMNPYIKADVALKGWLPSLHPAGRRPTMKGDNIFSNIWNKHLATKSTKHSNKEGYHPWFDEHAFDKFAGESTPVNILKQALTVSEKPLRTDKNNYPIYDKKSEKAQDFRTAFRNARKQGQDIFTWDNRDYTTELK